MKFILSSNPNPPYNLRRHSLPYNAISPVFDTEEELVAHMVDTFKQVGLIPCETEAERDRYWANYITVHDAAVAADPTRDPAYSLVLPPVGEHWVVDEADLPGGAVNEENNYFFDCWEWDDGATVNMTKARVIHMNVIRAARNKELAAKDIPWMKAVEAGDTDAQATIATEKQVLRDLPATFDITTGVTTPVQLKAKWPTELPARE